MRERERKESEGVRLKGTRKRRERVGKQESEREEKGDERVRERRRE